MSKTDRIRSPLWKGRQGALWSYEPNPIIVKEIRSRMRGWRAFATLTGTLVVLAAFSYALYRLILASNSYNPLPLSPQIGQNLFAGLTFLELLIVCAIAPALTAGAISGEKDRQTYEMLLTTPLPPGQILWGKLVSSLSYVFLVIFAALPLTSIIFIFGGVQLRDLLKSLVVLLVVAVMMGVIGLFYSALFGRTGRATIAAYLTVAILLFVPPLAAIFAGVLQQSNPLRMLMVPSPISALASAIKPSTRPELLSNFIGGFGNFYWLFDIPPISYDSIPRPLYHFSLPAFGLLTILLYLITTRLVLTTHRWRLRLSEVILTLVLLLGYLGLVTVFFAATSNRYENITIESAQRELPSVQELSIRPLPPWTS